MDIKGPSINEDYGYGCGDSWRNYGYSLAEIVNDNPGAARTDETGSTIYHNGIPTISKKARYVLDEKLGGVMIWSLDGDSRGKDSLLLAIDRVSQPKTEDKED